MSAAPNTAFASNTRLVEWFVKWRKPIRSWLRSRCSMAPGDIDDLAQEVFMRLLRYSDDAVIENPQGYLFRIAANVANEWQLRCRVRKQHEPSWLEELQIEPEDEPESICEHAQLLEEVRRAVDRLPPRKRHILLLHVNDGLTYDQIAERLNLTYRTVLRDLTRAYAALRMELHNA